MTYSEFKSQYQVRLNRQQEAAVRQTEGPVLLLAVPGSGKTTVLVTRLGHMIYCKKCLSHWCPDNLTPRKRYRNTPHIFHW